MIAPATLEDARAQWPDADTIPDDVLTDLLDRSWGRIMVFLPLEEVTAYEDVDPFPPLTLGRWIQANVLDARDLWTAARRDGDVIGFDTYAVRVRPLSDTVRSLLRPPRGRPSVG